MLGRFSDRQAVSRSRRAGRGRARQALGLVTLIGALGCVDLTPPASLVAPTFSDTPDAGASADTRGGESWDERGPADSAGPAVAEPDASTSTQTEGDAAVPVVADASAGVDRGVMSAADAGRPLVDAAVERAASPEIGIQRASTFHCGNWADDHDNFIDGNLVLSGLTQGDDHATVVSKAGTIFRELKTKFGVNSVRIPINEPTALGAWWSSYKGVIDAGVAQEMKIIVAYWAWHKGKEDDRARYLAMWQTVVDAYQGNNLVYFELFNNPYGYSPEEIIAFAAQWLDAHATVPRGRVIVAGSGYNDKVVQQGADSRLKGTLLSLQVFPFYNPKATTRAEWTSRLQTSLGGYEDRTILTGWGAPMTNGADYAGTGDGDNARSFVAGVSSYLREHGMGSCYWPILRRADTWALAKLVGGDSPSSLDLTNASGVGRLWFAFGL